MVAGKDERNGEIGSKGGNEYETARKEIGIRIHAPAALG